MKKPTKKQWLIAGLTCTLLLIAGLFVWNKINEPTDLGPKLAYVGKENTGCEWWQIPLMFGWCRGPNYNYYFATDMSEQELQNYFKNGTYQPDSAGAGGQGLAIDTTS